MTLLRAISKILLGLAGALTIIMAAAPFVIGASGGSGAGLVALGVILMSATYGLPTVAFLLLLGFIGLAMTNERRA